MVWKRKMQLLKVADLQSGNDLGTRGNEPGSSESLNHSLSQAIKTACSPQQAPKLGRLQDQAWKDSQFSAGLDPCLSLIPQEEAGSWRDPSKEQGLVPSLSSPPVPTQGKRGHKRQGSIVVWAVCDLSYKSGWWICRAIQVIGHMCPVWSDSVVLKHDLH